MEPIKIKIPITCSTVNKCTDIIGWISIFLAYIVGTILVWIMAYIVGLIIMKLVGMSDVLLPISDAMLLPIPLFCEIVFIVIFNILALISSGYVTVECIKKDNNKNK